MKRAAAKKAQQTVTPKNTENLTPAQRAQIEAAERRRTARPNTVSSESGGKE
jgi:hypothetical protein